MSTYRKSINTINPDRSSYTRAEVQERIEIENELNGDCDNFEIPSFLEGNVVAIEEFNKIAAELKKIGVISNLDSTQLGMYCQLYAQYVECIRLENEHGLFSEYTNKSGETNLVEAPWSKLKRQTESQMIALGKQFGLTPVDRLKMIPIKQNEKDNKDPLLNILKK
jgi:P27 family predicted phage terminase small subunit